MRRGRDVRCWMFDVGKREGKDIDWGIDYHLSSIIQHLLLEVER